ncbi:Poly-gamma-glutamate biosynthesis protein CapA/YwtB (capsule formation), metallophosphatase superfamily [Micromonospora pallida]|uniref:Poly-gamma-glutamate biosynthesis protein CapA/YwtB (Capsule formation), metallophosphatase superfamily n=1 Tax=Micromonospora pallida TaxID=145854 RepID=A0A1C6TEL1_9ACTN|nr:CapA family protein [Micromonospora pallida]SCL39933.1 Poly-gamma-glutamate biosynthesis protein CapA/YwtB (capsule formation), metallophosphatase superfamily [Micromonospora pallida]
MYAAASRHARRRSRRPVAALGMLLALLVVAGCGPDAETPAWQPADPSTASPDPAGSSAPPAEEEKVISLSATGDIIIGNAPNRLPPNGGKGFFDSVKTALEADLVMGNLEEPLTVDTGTGKCGANSTRCFQFRAPPEYAAHLKDAGFELLNQANNHGYDYGPAGYKNTQKALEEYGLKHTGAPDQITVVDVEGVKVAVAGFSSYVWSNSLVDIDAAEQVIEKAATMADLVVVQVHMGGEGSEKTRVKPGTEMFLGENRGDPVKFSKAMIDAGADLIVGHGPHVLRGMEFYQGRLIAYSLGNFAGGGNSLSNNGRLGWGGVLKVSLKADGTFVEGSFASTYMNGIGKPVPDPDDRGLGLLKTLTGQDFPKTGATFAADGTISAPDAG